MKVLGIVAEYNPFHNGHRYHLEQSKARCGADAAVCVMSGNFIQRGEPAIVDKWIRAETALRSGIDLVLELPAVYAMSSAEFFAFGAVKILDSLGAVDFMSFGSEAGSLEKLRLAADILCEEPDEYREMLKKGLSEGLSFPAAREAGLHKYIKAFRGEEALAGILGSSNNILGIEYLKALKRLGSKIVPLTIERKGNAYNDESITGEIASATSIRKSILEGTLPGSLAGIAGKLKETLPEESVEVLLREFEKGRGPVFMSDFDSALLSGLRKMSLAETGSLPYVSEGLENRIKKAAEASGTLEELILKVSTRRYTRTRIQRSLLSVLTGLSANELEAFNSAGGPQYIRILGFNKKGRHLLSLARKNTRLPLITKTADFKAADNPLAARMLQIEAASTDQYVLAYKDPQFRKSGQEFTRNLINLDG